MSDDDKPREEKKFKTRSLLEQHKHKVEKLLANPEKEVRIPQRRELQLPKLQEFDFHVQGFF